MPTATISVVTDGPRMAISSSASSSTGNANATSSTRVMTASTIPPASPAANPSRIAITIARPVAPRPMPSDSRAP